MNFRKKKPFSGKAKKMQLQAKRKVANADKDENKSSVKSPSPSRSSEVPPVEVNVHHEAKPSGQSLEVMKVHEQPMEGKKHNANRYRLHFAKESQEEIERRKKLSRQPLASLPKEALEVSFEDVHGHGFDLSFPRRPKWDYSMSKEEVEHNEQLAFDKWVGDVINAYGEDLSYFEINLETWRQLWRVLEISDIIMLLADVRCPVYDFPPALYDYVVGECGKDMVLVLNKIDLVPETAAVAWEKYIKQTFPKLHVARFASFPKDRVGTVEAVFHKKKRRMGKAKLAAYGRAQVLRACENCTFVKNNNTYTLRSWGASLPFNDTEAEEACDDKQSDWIEEEVSSPEGSDSDEEVADQPAVTELGKNEYEPHSDHVTIGVLGYPNVGKSSLLNGLVGKKVVSCSRTPGHTKHFQTIFLTPTVRLCDSPGIVFPSLMPRQLQIVSGIYPVSQVREPYSCVGYVAERLPLAKMLDLAWPYQDYDLQGKEIEDVNSGKWTAWAVCDGWASKRGYYTAKAGRFDTYRAANSILRLTAEGRIVLAFKPPGYYKSFEKSAQSIEGNGDQSPTKYLSEETHSSGQSELSNLDNGSVLSHNPFDALQGM